MRSLCIIVLLALSACVADPSPAPADVDRDTIDAGPTADASDDADVRGDVPRDTEPADLPDPPGPPTVLTDYTLGTGFFAAPFPDESRRGPDGTPDMSGYPNPRGVAFTSALIGLLENDVDGFGTTSGVFFTTSQPVDPGSLPDLRGSLGADAAMFLVGVDPGPDYLVRIPVTTFFEEDGGPYGAPNLLSLLPLQGRPLRPGTRYAAVVTDRVTSAGVPLERSSQMLSLARGQAPAGMSDAVAAEHHSAFTALGSADDIVAMAVFRTGHPTAQLRAAREAILAAPRPAPESEWVADEVFDDYCVYSTTVQMPVFQQGQPPFTYQGGDWVLGDDGRPVGQGTEQARVVVTLPRTSMPAGGFPTTVFVRTGGGGDRPLVDRGVHGEPHGPNLVEGAGPAAHLARAGYAGVSVDGPHGGLRNITGGDEQFLIFNFNNPVAMRDNIRQSALELILVAHMVGELRLPTTCPDLTTDDDVRLDGDALVLMGHSMGATIGPLALALEPRYRAAVFSGAGGSWIANVVHKLSPIPVRPLAELLIGYRIRELHEHDPVLSLLQWAGESADPPVYARQTIWEPEDAPRQVLMFQGIADTYILPPMANAMSLSLGLDLAGPALDADHPVAGAFPSLLSQIDLVGHGQIALPAAANLAVPGHPPVTGVVVQHPEDGVEDGHEVFFQTDAPKRQYECFLRGLRTGRPVVPADGPCPD